MLYVRDEQTCLFVSHISIVAKNYKDTQSLMNWKNINAEGGLVVILTRWGISSDAISRIVEAIDNGKCLVIEVGIDREASRQVQNILKKSVHFTQYF